MKNEKKSQLNENEINSNAQHSKMAFLNQKQARSSVDREQSGSNSEQLKNFEKISDSPYDIVATSPPSKSSCEIKETIINGNDQQPAEIPSYLVNEHRRLKEEKNELENRRQKLENYNKLLELQLNEFKQYVNNVDSLDSEVKQKLDQGIQETERMLQQEKDKQTYLGELKIPNVINSGPSTSTHNNSLKGIILNKNNSTKMSPKFPLSTPPLTQAQSFTRTYQQPMLHTAAEDVSNAVESLVNTFNNFYQDENIQEKELNLDRNCNENGIEMEVSLPETNQNNLEQMQSSQSYSGKVTHL